MGCGLRTAYKIWTRYKTRTGEHGSNSYAFLDPSLKLVAFLLNYFTCFPIHNMIVLTDVVCYGWFMVLIGRSSAGGSCEISVRDLFCFLSVFCDPGSQLSPCFTDIYLFAFSHMDTSDLHPQTRGDGASTEWFCAFIAIINTFRSLFKASDTFNVFQVLIKMADSHQHLNRLFHWYNKYARESSEKLLEQTSVTKRRSKFSCVIVLEFQK